MYNIEYKNVYIEDIIEIDNSFEGKIEDIALSVPYKEDYKLNFTYTNIPKNKVVFCNKSTHVTKKNLINFFFRAIQLASNEEYTITKSRYFETYIVSCANDLNKYENII